MKRLILTLIILAMSFTMIGCNNKQTPALYLETIKGIQDRIETLSDEATIFNPLEDFSLTQQIYTKSDLIDAYQTQTGLNVTMSRSIFLSEYNNLVNQILVSFPEAADIELNTFSSIDFGNYGTMNILLGFGSDKLLVFKMRYTENNKTILRAIKFGVIEDQLVIKEMKYSNYNAHDEQDTYYEFIQNQSFYSLEFDKDENYIYHFVSEENMEEIEVQGNMFSSEMDFHVLWSDFSRNIKFNFDLNQDLTILSEEIDYYNEYAILFSYIDEDSLDNDISLKWNLLETDGWDTVSLNSQVLITECTLYKNDTVLFPNDIILISLASNRIFLSLEKTFTQSQITNNILNLSEYNLLFHMDSLTLDYLDFTRGSAIDTVTHLKTNTRLDIYSITFRDSFISKIDLDLTYVVY